MKNILNKVMLACGVATLIIAPACNFLEPETKDVVFEEEYFRNYHDATAIVNGAYGGLQQLVERMFVLGEVRGELVKPGAGAPEELMQVFENRVLPTNRYTDWGGYYDVINRTNYVLANLGKIEKSPFYTEITEDQYIGEMLYLRSLMYYHLVRNFGDVPLVLKPTTAVDQDVNYPRVSQGIILDTIVANLDKADKIAVEDITELNNSLVVTRNNTLSRTRGVRAAVNALRTEVLLWRYTFHPTKAGDRKDLEAADAAAQRVYDDPDQYQLHGDNNAANWFVPFRTKYQNRESIFEIPFTFASRESHNLQQLTSIRPEEGGTGAVLPSDIALNGWKKPFTTTTFKHDARRGFGASYDSISPTRYEVYKWVGLDRITRTKIPTAPQGYIVNRAGRTKPYESDKNWFVFRFANLHLIRAEIRNLLGDRARALEYLNNLHNNRASLGNWPNFSTSNPNSITQEQMEDAIMQERSLDLAFEGHRFYDLMRVAKRRNNPAYLADKIANRVAETHPGKTEIVRSALMNPANWYIPINANEIRLNPSLR